MSKGKVFDTRATLYLLLTLQACSFVFPCLINPRRLGSKTIPPSQAVQSHGKEGFGIYEEMDGMARVGGVRVEWGVNKGMRNP